MKKATILLIFIMFLTFGIRCLVEIKLPSRGSVTPSVMDTDLMQTINFQLKRFSGNKISGKTVYELFDIVETWNAQEFFPTALRYTDVLPNSYNWEATPPVYITSGDKIKQNAFYEVVVQDQLYNDGYLDTITIRPYKMEYILTLTDSLGSGE